MVEVLLSSSQKEYRGFILVTKDFKHPDTGYKHREVYIHNLSAPIEVSNRLKLILLENNIDYFSAKKAAENCINRCYNGVKQTGRK